MDSFEEKIKEASLEELQELKTWFFGENIRLAAVAGELEEKQRLLDREKERFQEEVKHISSRITRERKRQKEDETFFKKKMEILQNGFWQLDADRRKLDKERARFEAEKDISEQNLYRDSIDVSVFFRGVKNPLALKKRYRDLIKIFHPDNLAGDKDVIQRINKEYENLKEEFDHYKQA